MPRGRGQTTTYLGLQASEPRQRSLQDEYRRADLALQHFDAARQLARDASDFGQEVLRANADRQAWNIVRDADPVRLSYVSDVLALANQTVRDWVEAGLLEDFGGAPQRVGLESVARIRELVRDIRNSGQQRDLLTAVLRALELEELRRDERFMTSVEQMKRGERANSAT